MLRAETFSGGRPDLSIVMPALVAGIHVSLCSTKDVDARHKAGHYGERFGFKHWKPSAEQVLVYLLPARGLGLEVVRRVDDRPVAALLRLELGNPRRDVRMHRQVVIVAEHHLAGTRHHEIDEQLGGV